MESLPEKVSVIGVWQYALYKPNIRTETIYDFFMIIFYFHTKIICNKRKVNRELITGRYYLITGRFLGIAGDWGEVKTG